MTEYDVNIYREGKWWMIRVPALDLISQSRRLSTVESIARELIGVTLDIDSNKFDIHLRIDSIDGVNVDERRMEIQRAHDLATTLELEAATKSRDLTRDLAAAGIPLRDIGEILGLSHQRAHQLLD